MTRNRWSRWWCLDSKHGTWTQRLRVWDQWLRVWLRIWLLLWLWVLPILQSSKNSDFFPLPTSLNLLRTLLEKMQCLATLLYKYKYMLNDWKFKELTRQVWHWLELFLPELGDCDGFIFLHLTINSHSLFRCMRQDALKILRLQRIEYVEKILSRWTSSWRILIGEILHEVSILGEVRPESFYRELVIMRNCDLYNISLLH